jgi:hypothetical protein
MPSYKDIYSANYLSVERWPETGERMTIESVGVDTDRFGSGDSREIIYVTFSGNPIRYRVNKTNAEAIAAVYGEEITDWVGRELHVRRYPTVVRGKKQWAGELLPVEDEPVKKVKKPR